MRIAIVVPRYGIEIYGGAEQHARLWAEHLAEYHDVEVITTCAKDCYEWANDFPEGTDEVNGITVHRFALTEVWNDECLHRIRDIYEKDRALSAEEYAFLKNIGPRSLDLLQYLSSSKDKYDRFIFLPYLYFTTILGLPIVREKTIFTPCSHDEEHFYHDFFTDLFKMPRVFAYNTAVERDFVQHQKRNSNVPSKIVGIGFDTKPLGNADRFFSAHPHVSTTFLLYVGRLDSNKGVGQLIDFFLRSQWEHASSVQLLLIGEGNFNIPKNDGIISLGGVPEQTKADALAAATALVNPSRQESFSMVLMEAWREQTPCLVYEKCAVTSHHIEQSGGGLTFHDADSFQDSVQKLLIKPRTAMTMGLAGNEYLTKNYSWDKVLARLDEALAIEPSVSHSPTAKAKKAIYSVKSPPETALSAQVNVISGSRSLKTLESKYFSIEITNTGTIPWKNDQNTKLHLSYHWKRIGDGVVSFEGHKVALHKALHPGDTSQVRLPVYAPLVPGDYELQFDLLNIPGQWFTQQGLPTLAMPIRVIHPSLDIPPEQFSIALSQFNSWGELHSEQWGAKNHLIIRVTNGIRRRLVKFLIGDLGARFGEMNKALTWLAAHAETRNSDTNSSTIGSRASDDPDVTRRRLHARTHLRETGFTASVIISTYNRHKALSWCLHSLEKSFLANRHAFQDIEVLICDDGGNDQSFEFVKSKQWPFSIKYIYQQNASFGLAANRNQGLAQAKGHYLIFLDADCIVPENFLAESIFELDKYPWTILSPEKFYLQEPVASLEKLSELKVTENVSDSGIDFRAFFRERSSLSKEWKGNQGLAFAFSREVAELVGLFDADYTTYGYEDVDYFFRAHMQNIPFNFSRQVKVYHQHHDVESGDILTESRRRFYEKHPIILQEEKEQRFHRLKRRLDQGSPLKILVDPNAVNDGINNSISIAQKSMVEAFRRLNHNCLVGTPQEEQDWDLIFGMVSHADNASRLFSGYEFYSTFASLVGETSRIPFTWTHRYTKHIDYFFPMSNHVREILANSGVPPHRMYTVSLPLPNEYLSDPITLERPAFLPKGFVFFSQFQMGSDLYQRKQWETTIRSFCAAFAGKDDVFLVISTDEIDLIKRFLSEQRGILKQQIILHDKKDNWLSELQLAELYSSINCYVLPSVEGFGLTQLEAMAMGTPTIGLNWGGLLDFMPFYGGHLVQLDPSCLQRCNHGWMPDGSIPRANGQHLTEVMRYIYDNFDECEQQSLRYKTALRDRFSPETIAQDIFRAMNTLLR